METGTKDMSRVVVVAEHKVLPQFASEFADLVRKHAKRCVDVETGCLVFSVSRNVEDEHRWHYYEIYASQADFDSHCVSSHFLEQMNLVKPMVDGDVRYSLSRSIELVTKPIL
jgi:quinol monooxygenase YgiN